MKKLLLFVLTSLFVGGALFAQTEESGKVKNEGNAAWRAKNYKEAFAKWEQYLKLIEFKDDATVYNVAVCANKLKDYANAEKYFGMSIKNNYKVASSYLGMADAQENLKKIPEMLKTLQDGIKATPGQNVKLEKAYSDYFAKEGQKFQKATPYATSEKEKYEAEKAKALADFKKAQDYLKQAATVEPTNEAVKETQKQVADAIAPLVEKK